ncbi:hypothetical protein JoomaDRAFT_0409 [Galbibacter orientalis DSM 19592]|uniref:Uncharacterized protein n=1 Tax=Galbibacter orientalis DSM 19592 TaxID=926559 RepID=I3C1H1_9FLAO|nr:hypothetical protein JoomaDRAFT_0409 [Galbibacter orientalis DSM 19592]
MYRVKIVNPHIFIILAYEAEEVYNTTNYSNK